MEQKKIVKINGQEIEVPEGFEVVVDKEGNVRVIEKDIQEEKQEQDWAIFLVGGPILTFIFAGFTILLLFAALLKGIYCNYINPDFCSNSLFRIKLTDLITISFLFIVAFSYFWTVKSYVNIEPIKKFFHLIKTFSHKTTQI